VSQWAIVHRKHFREFVGAWNAAFVSSLDAKKMLTLLYLANDIVQNARKKTEDFGKAYSDVLPSCLGYFARVSQRDSASLAAAMRVVKIWEERHIFGPPLLAQLTRALRGGASGNGPDGSAASVASSTDDSPASAPAARTPETPLMRVLRATEESSVRDALLARRVSELPPSVFSGDCSSQHGDFTRGVGAQGEGAFLGEVEEGPTRFSAKACFPLQQRESVSICVVRRWNAEDAAGTAMGLLLEQRAVLEGALSLRNQLVGLLSEALDRQESAIRDIQARLDVCAVTSRGLEEVTGKGEEAERGRAGGKAD